MIAVHIILVDAPSSMNEVENIEPAEVLMEHNYSSIQFKPLFVQRIERNLSLDSVIQASETVIAGVEDSEDDLLVLIYPVLICAYDMIWNT